MGFVHSAIAEAKAAYVSAGMYVDPSGARASSADEYRAALQQAKARLQRVHAAATAASGMLPTHERSRLLAAIVRIRQRLRPVRLGEAKDEVVAAVAQARRGGA